MEEERTWQGGEEKKVRRRGGGVKAERGGKGTCTCTYRCRRWVAHSGTPFNADTMGTITAWCPEYRPCSGLARKANQRLLLCIPVPL